MLAAAGDDNYKYFVMGNPWTIFSNVVVVVVAIFVAGSLLTLSLSLKTTKKYPSRRVSSLSLTSAGFEFLIPAPEVMFSIRTSPKQTKNRIMRITLNARYGLFFTSLLLLFAQFASSSSLHTSAHTHTHVQTR